MNNLPDKPEPVINTRNGFAKNKIIRELLTVIQFGIVGIGATGVHILVAIILLTLTSIPALAANLVAFLSAFGISFVGNYFWTFRSSISLRKAMGRFLTISFCAITLNSLLMAILLHLEYFPPVTTAIISAGIVPIITFLASRLWGFQE